MIEIYFTPSFVRIYKKLEPNLQVIVKEKTEEFKDKGNHQKLKVHKLHGDMKGFCSFSIDYKNRIVFEWAGSDNVHFYSIGDHAVYN